MISIVMPVYNAAPYLAKSIESILSQSEPDFELIIVNDGSTDDSEAIISTYSDPRIRSVKQDNTGVAAARNKALAMAQGEFITFQDADDISLPQRLETLKHGFQSPNVGIVHSDLLLINEKEEPLGYLSSQNIKRSRLLRFFIEIGTPFNNASMMIRRHAIGDHRYDSQFIIGEDTDLIFRISLTWDSIHVPEPLLLYRRHDMNVTKNADHKALALHVQKLLQSYSLQQLVPELIWDQGASQEIEAKASAILFLLLFRRGFMEESQKWLQQAKEKANSTKESMKFITALVCLGAERYEDCIKLLIACENKDHVVKNYLGEALALKGEPEKAFQQFMSALQSAPEYAEPLENLRALGYLRHPYFVDYSPFKFLKQHRE